MKKRQFETAVKRILRKEGAYPQNPPRRWSSLCAFLPKGEKEAGVAAIEHDMTENGGTGVGLIYHRGIYFFDGKELKILIPLTRWRYPGDDRPKDYWHIESLELFRSRHTVVVRNHVKHPTQKAFVIKLG